MKKRGTSLLVVALLLLVGITSRYVAGTFAKYAGEIKDNNGTATVAKWNFTTENTAQTLTIALAETYDASTLVANKIAPGTSGSFNIALTNGTTETGVDFTVKLNSITGAPANLKFYKDQEHTTELTPGTSTITGQLAAKDATGLTVPIYWAWEFGTSDEVDNAVNVADTEAGEAASSLTIGVDIKGVQTAPSTTAITSHVD